MGLLFSIYSWVYNICWGYEKMRLQKTWGFNYEMSTDVISCVVKQAGGIVTESHFQPSLFFPGNAEV